MLFAAGEDPLPFALSRSLNVIIITQVFLVRNLLLVLRRSLSVLVSVPFKIQTILKITVFTNNHIFFRFSAALGVTTLTRFHYLLPPSGRTSKCPA
jgi:hypothetical protein